MKLKLMGINVGWLMGNKQLKVGDYLPNFTLQNENGDKVTTEDFKGKLSLISVIPSLATKVCSLETARFNQVASSFKKINFVTISNDPISKQKNWCAAHNADDMKILSDQQGSFGKMLHLYIPLFRHLARVVYIVDANGKIIYEQVVHEVTNEPNYDLVINELKKLTNS